MTFFGHDPSVLTIYGEAAFAIVCTLWAPVAAIDATQAVRAWWRKRQRVKRISAIQKRKQLIRVTQQHIDAHYALFMENNRECSFFPQDW